jgi:hypothetical protein
VSAPELTDLTMAVMSDCLRAVTDAFNPGLGG